MDRKGGPESESKIECTKEGGSEVSVWFNTSLTHTDTHTNTRVRDLTKKPSVTHTVCVHRSLGSDLDKVHSKL